MTSTASPQPIPFGAWPSPIAAARLVEGAASVNEVRVDGADVWWSESRPDEGGRNQLVRLSPDGTRVDVLPEGSNARTAAHEYGGGAWAVRGGVVVFSQWADQRLYRLEPDGVPEPLTPEPSVPRGLRWADIDWLDDGWVVAVRESHEAGGEAVNELVAVPLDGSAVTDPGRVRVLVSGPDFVSSPRMGGVLAWTQWDHPRMPWDGTELWIGVVEHDQHGAPIGVSGARQVAGGPDESIVQPEWTADRQLLFLSDRTGWWNPWRDAGDVPEPVAEVQGEIGGPQWVFGGRWFAPLPDGRLACSVVHSGLTGLCVVEPDGTVLDVESDLTSVDHVVPAQDGSHDAVIVAASPTTETNVYRWRVGGAGPAHLTPLRPPRDPGLDPSWFSAAEPIEFPSAGGRVAHGLYYPPVNPTVSAPEAERPPLLVFTHGGPTSAARAQLDLAKQFWTSRGFAIVDVNYGGSTGYGRPYRRLLDDAWGLVDVEDCIAAARFLADDGRVDGERLAIRGGSAGGYTTLAALTFHDTFAAGASHYGVADLEALARETHKFESRYLDGLIGPYPKAVDVYRARSPILHTGGLDRPLIVFQGMEDEIVPPNQAEMMIAALAAKGVPHAYVAFESEQHGFRKAENIVRSLEAELWFYGRVFGFAPADDIAPVEGAVGLV